MTRNRIVLPLPETPGGWPCIVADPPWSFRDKGSRAAPDQRRKRLGRKGYRTLGLDDLIALDVRSIAADDALLFLWTTSAHLLDGTSPMVAREWGFDPKVTIAWVKTRGVSIREVFRRAPAQEAFFPVVQRGFGHYVRGAHELVIVAARGRATQLIQDRGVPSVLFAPRGEHSAKPAEFRALVERLAGRLPTLEMFARSEHDGWTAWGDQAPARRTA